MTDGMFGPVTKFAMSLMGKSPWELRSIASEQYRLRLAAEYKVKRLKKKLKKARKKFGD